MPENQSLAGRLWIAAAAERFFVLADDVKFAAGPDWVADLDVGESRVDLGPWAPFEITESQAAERYREQLADGGQVALEALGAASATAMQALPGLATLLERLGDPKAAAALDGPEALRLLSGRSAAAISADPAAARDAVLDALQALSAPETAQTVGVASDAPMATPAEQAALGAIIERWTFGASGVAPVSAAMALDVEPATAGDLPAHPRALLDALRRAVTNLGTFEPTESSEARLARYQVDARAEIDRATAGWKPPTPTVEELLRMGDEN